MMQTMSEKPIVCFHKAQGNQKIKKQTFESKSEWKLNNMAGYNNGLVRNTYTSSANVIRYFPTHYCTYHSSDRQYWTEKWILQMNEKRKLIKGIHNAKKQREAKRYVSTYTEQIQSKIHNLYAYLRDRKTKIIGYSRLSRWWIPNLQTNHKILVNPRIQTTKQILILHFQLKKETKGLLFIQLVSTHYQTKKVATPLIILRLITFLNILNYIREIHNSCIKYIILINFVTGYCRIKSVLLTAEPKT